MPCTIEDIRAYILLLAPEIEPHKIPVYSVLVGDYDIPVCPKGSEKFSFYLFTDQCNLTEVQGWRIIYLPPIDMHPILLTRAVKTLCHLLFPNNSKVFYFDASFYCRRYVDDIVADFDFGEFLAFKHPNRVSINQEISACIQFGKENELVKDRVNSFCGTELFDCSCLLLAGGFLGRNPMCEQVQKAMDLWFLCIFHISFRDQITLPYVLSKCGVDVNIIRLNIYSNKYLIPRPHKSESFLYSLKWRLGLILRDMGVRCIGKASRFTASVKKG